MEDEPDLDNVVDLNEVRGARIERLGQLVLFTSDMGETTLTLFETVEEDPDDAA